MADHLERIDVKAAGGMKMNDMEFKMIWTRVKDGMTVTKASLFEVKEHKYKTDWHVCQTENGGHVLSLDDEVDAKYQEKRTPTAKTQVNKLLSYLCRQWRSRSLASGGAGGSLINIFEVRENDFADHCADDQGCQVARITDALYADQFRHEEAERGGGWGRWDKYILEKL